MSYQNIILHGFRATGKTTVAAILAEKLAWKLVEMDKEIEKISQMSITQLTQNGTNWTHMRQIESDLFASLVKEKNLVISTGGGVCVNNVLNRNSQQTFGQVNTEIAKQSGHSLNIVLTAYIDTIVSRIRKDELAKTNITRPILNENKAKELNRTFTYLINDPTKQREILVKEIIEDSIRTYLTRQPLYLALSSYIIHTDFLSPKRIGQEILQIFNSSK